MARVKRQAHGPLKKKRSPTPSLTPPKPFAPPPHNPKSLIVRKSTVQNPVRIRILPPRKVREKVPVEVDEDSEFEPVEETLIKNTKKSARKVTQESSPKLSQDSPANVNQDLPAKTPEYSPTTTRESSPFPVEGTSAAADTSNKGFLKCPVIGCTKTYPSRYGLDLHQFTSHRKKGQGIHRLTFDAETKLYKCLVTRCDKTYGSANGVEYHLFHGHRHEQPEQPAMSNEEKLAMFRAERDITMPVSEDQIESAEPKKRGRSKKAQPAANSPADEDSIRVQHTVARGSAETSPLSDVGSLSINAPPTTNPSANRGWARKGKEPARNMPAPRDIVMINTDEPEYEDEDVDEGSIDYNDHTLSEHELDSMDDAPVDVIALDDDTDDDEAPVPDHMKKKYKDREEANQLALSHSPWKVEGFGLAERATLEVMYCDVQMTPIQGSWETTEAYQFHKDKEMLRYLVDFPLGQWLLPKEHAQAAYMRLLERSRWRELGIRVYGGQGVPQSTPSSMYNQNGRPANMAAPWMPAYGTPTPYNGNRAPSMPHQQMQMPQRPPPGPAMPPPNHVLPSQQHAASGVGYPTPHQYPHPQLMMGPPQPPQPHYGTSYNNQHAQNGGYANTLPAYPGMAGGPQGIMPAGMHGHGQGRGGRKKKSPAAQSPGPTPPYPVRDRPAERKKFNKTGKRNVRKQAEAEEFPWHRELDFMALKHVLPLHRWNTNEYDPNILDAMAAVRVQNGPIILKIDQELADKQKNSRNRKKGVSDTPNRGSTMGEDTGDNDSDEEDAGKGTLTKRKNENIGGDPYYSGNFSFVKEADRLKALEFGFKTPDDLLDAAEQVTDPHSRAALREACKKVMICWNPGKKGATEQLEQAVFRAYDTLITREQYDRTLILTKRAAECIVDFCPDLLWRETLLRMVAEAGYGNTDIRNRFCYNGCYADKATITKRIAAALGQKQVNQPRKKDMQAAEDSGEPGSSSKLGRRRGPEAKTKGERYLGGEKEWHDGNKKDFDDYVRFFGLRPGSGYLRKPKAGEKRRMSGGGGSGGAGGEEMEMEDTVGGASREDSSSGRDVKRARTEETAASPGTMSEEAAESGSPEVEDEEEDEQDEGGDDEDAVSEQSDGVLDEIED